MRPFFQLSLPFLLAITIAPSLAVSQQTDAREQVDLWTAAKGDYALYRIPAVVAAPKTGTLLAFCEARATAGGDWGKIDILMRRSTDGGKTWEPAKKVVEPPAGIEKNLVAVEQKLGKPGLITVGNPVAIADPSSGAIHVLYCVEYARCFYMRTDDAGQTFSKPVEITSAFEAFRPKYPWRVLASGPGHAIRLSTTGRLVVPVWLSKGEGGHGHRPSCVATIYSDDSGKTWKAGEIIADHPDPVNPSEAAVAELSDGRVMFNFRHEGTPDAPTKGDKATWRAVSISRDGATGWEPFHLDPSLAEPVCMGSLLRIGKSSLLFSNPDNADNHRRRNLTIHASSDDGRTWPAKRVIEAGVGGYSDLACSPDGKWVYCLYERGTTTDDRHNDVAALTFVRLSREWLEAGR